MRDLLGTEIREGVFVAVIKRLKGNHQFTIVKIREIRSGHFNLNQYVILNVWEEVSQYNHDKAEYQYVLGNKNNYHLMTDLSYKSETKLRQKVNLTGRRFSKDMMVIPREKIDPTLAKVLDGKIVEIENKDYKPLVIINA